MEAETILQWHPAFCAAIELELREDKKILEYEREYNLSKMPLRIDFLVIKKKPNEVIKNEIGDFFRGNNLMEYKAPGDVINIDTYYKVLAYACLYKAETGGADEIKDTDITVSLIREEKPRKLLAWLKERYYVTSRSPGIYRVDKMLFPMQIVVTEELKPEDHVWLKALTRSMRQEEVEKLVGKFQELEDEQDRENARSLIDLTTNANEELMEQIITEGGNMSEGLKAIIEAEVAKLRAQLADKDAKLADKDAKLADYEVELANQKAENERLRKQLAEI